MSTPDTPTHLGAPLEPEGLRRRLVANPTRADVDPLIDDQANPSGTGNSDDRGETPSVPQGKTPNGTVFEIPQTHNMLSSLFHPKFNKSNIDLLTLFLLGTQLVLFFVLPRSIGRWFFGLYFAFWRIAYDGGLGYVLRKQSENRWIVRSVARAGWFDLARQPKIARWVRDELGKKMGKDFHFDSLPLEYNVWILFRHSVDVILLNDFLAHALFSLSFLTLAGPPGHSTLFHVLRWTGGLVLLLFNLWVKVDAHRIVKDFAWYWGDCFFESSDCLVFDGVFLLAPHPMYSIGYAYFYGTALIVASPVVLLVSILAHAAQFGFLVWFENPHIERTYGQRKPVAARTPLISPSATRASSTSAHDSVNPFDAQAKFVSRLDLDNKYFQKELMIFKNWDCFRARDFAFVLVIVYATLPTLFSSLSQRSRLAALACHALAWRTFHTGVLGWILKLQSERKYVVRHFLKHYHYEKEGDAVVDAFVNWKSIYNLSLCMTYVSFGALAWQCYSVPADWTIGSELVRHALGLLLIALHIWTATSTFDALGPFGWFYGDFFITDYPHELYYEGVFRFLNNPERSMGGAAFFGLVLLSASKLVLAQAVVAVLAHWWFLSCVENPHMQRLYGKTLRKDAGVTQTLRNAVRRVSVSSQKTKPAHRGELFDRLSKNVREVQGSVEKVFEETAEAVEEFLSSRAPAVKGYVEDTKVLFQQTGERLVISRIAKDLAQFDSTMYGLTLSPSSFPPLVPHASTSSAPSLRYHLGEPIKVSWVAPLAHSRRDWIGLYRLGANSSNLVTKVSSQGRWVGIFQDDWDGDVYVKKADGKDGRGDDKTSQVGGTVLFSGKRLAPRVGKFEFRHHHDGKHSVMSCSEPFEIFVDQPSNPDDATSVRVTTTHIVAKTLGLDPAVIPASARFLVEGAQAKDRRPSTLRSSPVETHKHVDALDKGKGSASSDDDEPSGVEAKGIDLLDADDFVLYSQTEAASIAYAIKVAFDVELDAEVVLAAPNVAKLASRITEARRLLRPGEAGREMKADLVEG